MNILHLVEQRGVEGHVGVTRLGNSDVSALPSIGQYTSSRYQARPLLYSMQDGIIEKPYLRLFFNDLSLDQI